MLSDVIIILVLFVMTLSGYRRGLIAALCGLMVLALSFLGANFAQSTFSDTAEDWIRPQVEESIAEMVEEWVQDKVSDTVEQGESLGFTIAGKDVSVEDLVNLLKTFGIDVEEKIQNAAGAASEPVAEVFAKALTDAVVETLAKVIVWILAFIILYLVLDAAVLLINVADKVPGVHGLNHLFGGVFGCATAVLLVFAMVYFLESSGLLGDEAMGSPTVGLVQSLVQGIVSK